MQKAILSDIEQFVAQKEHNLLSVLHYIRDKTTPLDDRWAVYCKAVEGSIITADTSSLSCMDCLGNSLCPVDDLGIGQNEYRSFVEIYSELGEYSGTIYSQKQLQELKEEFMATGLAGFVNDC